MNRLLLAAALLLAAPAAFAACVDRSDQAMSCAQGTMWDGDAGTCVPVVIG